MDANEKEAKLFSLFFKLTASVIMVVILSIGGCESYFEQLKYEHEVFKQGQINHLIAEGANSIEAKCVVEKKDDLLCYLAFKEK